MADVERGREKRAADAERRQRERVLEEALERADEPKPAAAETPATDESPSDRERTAGDESGSRECHRRGCSEPAAFVVRERSLEETGHGAVVAGAFLCREHAAEEAPTNLDRSFSESVFVVEPVAGKTSASTE